MQGLWGETGAPLGATSLDHLAATNSTHPSAEAVGTGTFEITGLKCTFHDG